MSTCQITPEVLDALKQFRFRKSKSNAALVFRIDVKSLAVILDGLHENIKLEDLSEELPENTPRFMVLSYELKLEDDRVSYPLVGIFYCPEGSNDTNRMLYASTEAQLFQQASISGKVLELHDAEDLTDEWLTQLLIASKTRK
ncbi:uncharacterized protein BJ171DRAFT_484923 [Polychytrium aggregatum]|uniref:uncharacterized protein n=1 Tax=Polychytrium aggregatum TaxID=110093 RepID=UPI0022FE3EFA|nr:uncharacterized protein BJ171DRAFT_484923 [Polychytrium aggregatum]KAI9209758.1 hypothetical protein BJ171DRAFT_484923 [Polychytrium aggregatum]